MERIRSSIIHTDQNKNINGCTASELNLMAEVTLSVLLSLKLSFVGIIYDSSAAQQLGFIVPRLSEHAIKVVTYSADDLITGNTTVVVQYLNMAIAMSRRKASLLLSADLYKTAAVFRGLSRYKTLMGRQRGIEHQTKWLTWVLCHCALGILEKDIPQFSNVAAISLDAANGSMKNDTAKSFLISTLIMKPDGRRFEPVGTVRGGEPKLHSDILFPNVRRGFNGRHFRIGVYVWSPFTMRVTRGNETTYQGFCVDLIIELAKRLNFTFSLTEPADNNWGSLLSDGNWTGVVGMLQKFEIDLSVAALIITDEREDVMDASFPFYYDNVGVMYKRYDPKDSLWKTYLHPFKLEVFLCIAGSLVGGAIIYVFIGVASPAGKQRQAQNGQRARDMIEEANYQAGQLMSSLIQHGERMLPSFGSGRMFLSFWWIFTIILAAIYKGNLTAFLLVPMDDVPFTTLEELATQDEYRWGVTGSTVVERLFQTSQRSDFRKLGEGIERFKASDPEINSLDPLVHLAKVKNGHYAYISDMVPMEIWITEDCDLRLLSQTVIPLPFVIGFHNNSALVGPFNRQLLDIDQMGLFSFWKDRWWPKGGSCTRASIHDTKVLSLLETQSAFYILCAGIIMSCLALFLEFSWKMVCCVSFRESIHGFFCAKKLHFNE